MNYQKVYEDFIRDRRSRESELETFDRHHVLPRCLGGGNEPENIIRLTPSDHLFAHVLLARIHGGLLVSTAARMSGMERYRGRESRRRYSIARRLHSRQVKKMWRDPETRERMIAPRRGQKSNPEANTKRSAALKGRSLTEQHKARLSEAMYRRIEKEALQ